MAGFRPTTSTTMENTPELKKVVFCPTFHSNYSISLDGKYVRRDSYNNPDSKTTKTAPLLYYTENDYSETKDGYYQINKAGLIHRLVMEAMLLKTGINEWPTSPSGRKLEVDHIDRNRKNNDISNLRLVTHKTNMLNISPEGYEAMRRGGMKGRRWIHKNGQVKAINAELLEQYFMDGWVIGRPQWCARKPKKMKDSYKKPSFVTMVNKDGLMISVAEDKVDSMIMEGWQLKLA